MATALTADLNLAGTACNVYGNDIQDLKLLVNYDSGNYSIFDFDQTNTNNNLGITTSCQDRGCGQSRLSGSNQRLPNASEQWISII